MMGKGQEDFAKVNMLLSPPHLVLVYLISRMFWNISVFYTVIRKRSVFCWHGSQRKMHLSLLLWVNVLSK